MILKIAKYYDENEKKDYGAKQEINAETYMKKRKIENMEE